MMRHMTLDHTLAITLLWVTLIACQPTPAGDLTQTPPPPSATATQSAFVNPPINPTIITQTPAPTRPATSTPQPFITDGGALPEGARMRIGIGYINAAAPSPDGTMVAVGTSTGIYVYRLPGFERVWRRYTEFPVYSVEWSPDSTRLVTETTPSASARLWDAYTGEGIALVGDLGEANWSPDGSMIASRRWYDVVPTADPTAPIIEPGGVEIFDGRTGELLDDLEVPIGSTGNPYITVPSEVIWSPDGHIVAAEANSESIIGWNVQSGTIAFQLPATTDYSTTINYSPDGQYISVSDYNTGIVEIWDIDVAHQIAALTHEPYGYGVVTAWSYDGTRLAAMGYFNGAVFSATNWSLLFEFEPADSLSWSPHDTFLATTDNAATTILDALTGQTLHILPDDDSPDWYSSEDHAWFSDETHLLIWSARNLAVWNIGTEVVEMGFSTTTSVSEIGWSPDGNTLVLFDPEAGDYQFWDVEAGEASGVAPIDLDPSSLFPTTRDLSQLNLQSPDGTFTALAWHDRACGDGPRGGGCFYHDGNIRVVHQPSGRVVYVEQYPNNGITALAWSHDSSMLAIGLGRN